MQTTQQVGLEEASTHLKDLINAALAGENVVIVKDERAMVKLVPMTPRPRRRAGSAKGMIHMADDFDAPLEDFEEYMP
jgi:antitoxin (DNA-binding transcriptional repressor) of toxin-antitoxin stability system